MKVTRAVASVGLTGSQLMLLQCPAIIVSLFFV